MKLTIMRNYIKNLPYFSADRVASIVPDTNQLMDRASKKESAMRIIGTDVAEKIKALEKKIAVARTAAKRINLGVQFFENTTLQMRNPEGIEKAATHTQFSMYFKTTERFGLLTFIGNEKGAHNQMKRVLTVSVCIGILCEWFL